MTLSIIIPVYNVEAYLAECLDSVFSQLVDECEVIAVNDGSTDNSRQILSEYKNRYPKLIVCDRENGGLSAARNTGMDKAKGEYLYFLDSDDYLLPNALATMLNAINKNNIDVLGFNAIVNVSTKYISSFNVSDIPKTGINYFEDFYLDNGAYPSFNVWLYLYKKSFLEENNHTFKEGLYHEDVLFTLKTFYYARNMRAFDIPICNYRQDRIGSICTNLKLKNLTDRSFACRELNGFFENNRFNNKHFYNVLFHQYLYNINLAVSNNFISAKRQYYNSEDKAIMKKGITNEYEYKLWVLAKLNFELFDNYAKNKLSSMQRKLINIIGSFLYK